ncbi:MAG: hypothetical protein NE330_08920 [Lentisphaeraceae bacterium]|nr:hypothetical protein [Lentisphaeraceae bacterium]
MKQLLFSLLLLLGYNPTFAKAALVPLEEKVKSCELIARIKVLEINKNLGGKFKSQAKILILDKIKGEDTGTEVILEFNNGLGCPNILYKLDDDCIIFAKKMKNGNYYTFNTYFGKVEVEINEQQEPIVSGHLFGSKTSISYSKSKEIINSNIK